MATNNYLEFTYNEKQVNKILDKINKAYDQLTSFYIAGYVGNLRSYIGSRNISLGVLADYDDNTKRDDFKKRIKAEHTCIDSTLKALQSMPEDKVKTTSDWASFLVGTLAVVEGIFTGLEQVIDGIGTAAAILVGFIPVVGDAWKEGISNFVKEDWVGKGFDALYDGPLAGLEAQSAFAHDEPPATGLKGFGVVLSYVAMAALTGGALGAAGMAGGAWTGVASVVGDMVITALGTLGDQTQQGLQNGLTIDQAAKEALDDVALQTLAAGVIGGAFEFGPGMFKYGGKAIKETFQTAGSKGLKTAVKESFEGVGKDIFGETAEMAAKKAGNKFFGKQGKSALTDVLGKKGYKQFTEALGPEAIEKLSKELGPEGIEKLAKELGPDGLQKFAKSAGGNGFEGMTKDAILSSSKNFTNAGGELVENSITDTATTGIKKLEGAMGDAGNAGKGGTNLGADAGKGGTNLGADAGKGGTNLGDTSNAKSYTFNDDGTTIIRDSNGNVTETWKSYDLNNADGTKSYVTETFDANGKQTGYTDVTKTADGMDISKTSLDADGNVKYQEYKVNNADGTTSNVQEFFEGGKESRYVDTTVDFSDGNRTVNRTVLDGDGNLVSTSKSYDVINSDDSVSHIKEMFDGDGNVKSYTDTTFKSDGSKTTTILDGDGNVKYQSITDANGNQTKLTDLTGNIGDSSRHMGDGANLGDGLKQIDPNAPKVDIDPNAPKVDTNAPKVDADPNAPKVDADPNAPKVDADPNAPKVDADPNAPKVDADPNVKAPDGDVSGKPRRTLKEMLQGIGKKGTSEGAQEAGERIVRKGTKEALEEGAETAAGKTLKETISEGLENLSKKTPVKIAEKYIVHDNKDELFGGGSGPQGDTPNGGDDIPDDSIVGDNTGDDYTGGDDYDYTGGDDNTGGYYPDGDDYTGGDYSGDDGDTGTPDYDDDDGTTDTYPDDGDTGTNGNDGNDGNDGSDGNNGNDGNDGNDGGYGNDDPWNPGTQWPGDGDTGTNDILDDLTSLEGTDSESSSLLDEFGDAADLGEIVDLAGGVNIPTSADPIRTKVNTKDNNMIPLMAGLGAAALAGLGTKAYLERKENKDEEDELEADEWEEEDAAELALENAAIENDLEESDYLLPTDEYAFQPETASIEDEEDDGDKYQAVNSSDLPSMN